MSENQIKQANQNFRGMATNEIIEFLLKGEPSTEEADAAHNIIYERGFSPKQLENEKKKMLADKPYGVGGWLAFLVFTMVFLGPLSGIMQLHSVLFEAEHKYPHLISSSEWITYKSTYWWSLLVVCALSIYGGLTLGRGSEWRAVTRAKLILWIAGPIATACMVVLIPVYAYGKMDPIALLIKPIFISTLSATIWTAYLSKSKRVHNTYAGK